MKLLNPKFVRGGKVIRYVLFDPPPLMGRPSQLESKLRQGQKEAEISTAEDAAKEYAVALAESREHYESGERPA